ncbi:MAG: motility associated factor glycosyltransferase family protein, partial [Tepidisphaeraceae bacterium]
TPFVENMAALWAVDPGLAALVDAVSDEDALAIEPSRAGPMTAAVSAQGRSAIYLHSRYDPVAEAVKQTARIAPDCLQVFVLGLGLGHHVAAIRQRCSQATLWVLEPDARILRAAFETADLSHAIGERKIRFIHSINKSALFIEWMGHLAAMSAGHSRFEHPPSLQLHPDFFEQARGLLDEFLAYGKTTINTLLINSKRTCENLARNVPWYVASPGVGRLRNAMAGKPAIVVSAGPSLRKNKHLLKQAAGHAVIICVQTAFQQLVDLGIEPQFVTSLEYHDICTQFFQHIPRSVRTELVAEPKATPKIFELNPGPVSLLGNDFVERLLREMQLNRPRLNAGATVAHLAFYLAEFLGCDPVIFIGQDLGFSDGLAYAPGTSYDDLWRPELGRYNTVEMLQWQRIVRDRHILRRIPDHLGRPMYTEERLYTYLQQFERDFAKSGRTIIDATEGGAAKQGARSMTLQDALNEFCREPLPTAPPAHAGPDWKRLPEARKCLEARREEAERITVVSQETMPLLRDILQSLDEQSRVNRLISQIDLLRTRMNDVGMTYEMVMQLTQRSELDRFAADQRIAAADINAAERQRRQLHRDIGNVEHVIRAGQEFQTLMSECIREVDQAIARHREAA